MIKSGIQQGVAVHDLVQGKPVWYGGPLWRADELQQELHLGGRPEYRKYRTIIIKRLWKTAKPAEICVRIY
jgi:hypothetical protein